MILPPGSRLTSLCGRVPAIREDHHHHHPQRTINAEATTSIPDPLSPGSVTINVMTEDKAPASRRASRLHHRRVMRVASPPEYFAGDGVVGPVTPLHDLQRTGSISATGSRVPAKKTHSMLSLCDEDDDEGKIVSDGSASTELSSKSSVKPTVGPPPRSLSWRNYLAVRGWLHEVSFEDVLPMVALTMALGALVFTVVILGRRSASRGGH
ncbi:hypothetical protein HPB51_009718 [Rhipicephalus microplus]|uniref:Uncharacterized protein n=1 Tax=Rhipicephalus microplus TaxID=6941 RepID=A0A9J6ERY0_RHIMP|nr:hypothetical protein HPB51_009718 [Rhipicephalus microplus]